MTRIILSTRKTLEEQASARFDAAKKAKRKLDGITATITRFERELPQTQERVAYSAPRVKAWYERFRWSYTTSGVLLIGGRDAGTNEVIIKKHLEDRDIVFHTELPSSPFVLLKPEAHQQLTNTDKEEAAQFCAVYSRLWKAGAAVGDVFWVFPGQVSKTANTGEFVGRGSFMIRGEKHFLRPNVTIAIGIIDGAPTSGVAELFAKRPGVYVLLAPGDEKSSDTARKLLKKLPGIADQYVQVIPPGGTRLLGWKRGAGADPSLDFVEEPTENV